MSLNEESHQATVDVAADQFSLAVGKGGQNVRLAAKLSGWKIDITTPDLGEETKEEADPAEPVASPDPAASPTADSDNQDEAN